MLFTLVFVLSIVNILMPLFFLFNPSKFNFLNLVYMTMALYVGARVHSVMFSPIESNILYTLVGLSITFYGMALPFYCMKILKDAFENSFEKSFQERLKRTDKLNN